jgi:hypothetical protein
MLYLSTKLTNAPLLSIRNSGRVGTVLSPIINPHSLHIDAFYCKTSQSLSQTVLLDMFIREISPSGFIIDDHNNLSDKEELVRLTEVLRINFQLLNKLVLSGKRKIGRVSEYSVDKESLFIQKIYVEPPVWQSLNKSQLTIDRNSIIEVTDSYIRISGPEEKASLKSAAMSPFLSKDYSANTSLINE